MEAVQRRKRGREGDAKVNLLVRAKRVGINDFGMATTKLFEPSRTKRVRRRGKATVT